MSAPPIGMIMQHAEDKRDHHHDRETASVCRDEHQIASDPATATAEHRQVDDILALDR